MSEHTHTRTRTTEDETETESERDESTDCPECGGRLAADSEHGETVCTECGLVVEEDEIDRGPEWRAFDSAEKTRNPASAPPPPT